MFRSVSLLLLTGLVLAVPTSPDLSADEVTNRFGVTTITPSLKTVNVEAAPMPREASAIVQEKVGQPKPDPAKGKPRGLKPTPKFKLFAAPQFQPTTTVALPTSVAYIPKTLSMWGNSQYGDCVSAEEAFNQASCGVFIPEATVISWARTHGYLNGAYLSEVMDTMQTKGFSVGGKTYGIGPYFSVNFANPNTLQSALSIAPVKVGGDADALPNAAGDKQGWWAAGGRPGQYDNEDHCWCLCGYGTPQQMFSALGATVPPTWPAASTTAYLAFTWSTIGVVDHDWIMSTVAEAYVRNPDQTINKQPQPNPGPGPNPPPPPPVPPSPPTPPTPPTPPVPTTGDIKIDLASKNITAPQGWTLNGGSMPPSPTPGVSSPVVEFVKNHAAKKQARKDGAGIIVTRAELAAARAKIDLAVDDTTVSELVKDTLKKANASDKLGGPFTDFIEWITTHQAELEALIQLILKLVALFGL